MAKIQIADLDQAQNLISLVDANELNEIYGGGKIARAIGLAVEAILTFFGL
ncbi:hypothetical protein [Nodularia spumigena]|uniref:hypothetical protein n=1 Tax=Nodularia spumigena TaxID=70799 RepID=UPI002B2142C1|nr:hypothetical protein [Nodularia spumigena]MEA5558827.1 hypothetical protein [Nodularia spumigena CH309]